MSAKSAEQLFNEAIAQFDRGDSEGALQAARRALDAGANRGPVLHFCATVEFSRGRPGEAIDYFRQAAEAMPGQASFHNDLGVALLSQQRVDEAEQAFRQATRIEPGLAPPHYNLGSALKIKGNFAEAESEFRKTLQADPGVAEAHYELGNVLFRQGRFDDAIASWRRVLEINPQIIQVQVNIGEALFALERDREAIEVLQQVATAAPGSPVPYLVMGRMLLRQHENREVAVEMFRQAARRAPDLPEAQGGLAEALARTHKYPEAIEVGQRAIELAPKSPQAHYALAVAFEATGKSTEAARHYQTAAALSPQAARLQYEAASVSPDQPKPAAAPPDFLKALFGDYAPTFDKHLVEDLKYRAPQLLFEAARTANVGENLDMLDLGCGTGLAGVVFQPIVKSMVGVELVPEMIEVAKTRKLYDELVEAELHAYLRDNRERRFDLVVAADVFCYIGDLAEAVQLSAEILNPNGALIFSVESLEESSSEEFVLRPSRRYAHSIEYLRRLTRDSGLQEVLVRQEILREEYEKPMAGWIVVLRKS